MTICLNTPPSRHKKLYCKIAYRCCISTEQMFFSEKSGFFFKKICLFETKFKNSSFQENVWFLMQYQIKFVSRRQSFRTMKIPLLKVMKYITFFCVMNLQFIKRYMYNLNQREVSKHNSRMPCI